MFRTPRIPSSFLVGLLAALVLPAALRAMPPNDRFADALEIESGAGQVAASTAGASRETGEPNHAGNAGGASIWFFWVAPRGGLLTVYTFGSSFDTTLAAYTGTAVNALETEDENDDADIGFFQSLIAFPVVAGREYRIAVDGFNGAGGNVLVTWFLGSTGARPVNDDFASNVVLDGVSGRAFGTTVLGTTELDEPIHHPEASGGTIWWKWTAPIDGEVTFDTRGSSFFNVLAAYEGTTLGALERMARDTPVDRIDPDFPLIPDPDEPSQISFRAERDTEYHLAVDGVFATTGIAVLNWLITVPCDPPRAPVSPTPADNAVGVERTVTLRWTPGDAEQRVFVERVIYGDDGRQDAYEVLDPRQQEVLDSVAVVVNRADLSDNGDGTFSLSAPTLRDGSGFCASERFADQPVPGLCSGFLAAPDRIATAGSCVDDTIECAGIAFVFGFEMRDRSTPVMTFPAEQIYFCDGILGRQFNPAGTDWAVIQLDRPVVGRTPLAVRRNQRIADGAGLVFAGHPFGLPIKVDAGARVRDNSAEDFFVASIDSSRGSAGAPIFDRETLRVEGIVVRGEDDTVLEGDCFVSRRCGENACRGQDVTRATEFQHLVPADLETVVFEVWFGVGCGNLVMVGETAETSFSLPDRLERNTIYCWRIGARNECGIVFGPRWTFVTNAAIDLEFRRGDVNADRAINLSDGVALLNWLFQQGEEPGCQKSADVDDNRQINLTDAVFILNHLFLQGPSPPPPFEDCGVDPTPEDGVTCTAFPACAG